MASSSTNFSRNTEPSVAYELPLQYLGQNEYGAHMFRDPLKHTVVHIEDHEVEFDPNPMYDY